MNFQSDATLYETLSEKLERVSFHGEYFSCLCPFHDDSSPSMLVYQDGFSCKGCGKSGSLKFLSSKVSNTVMVYTVSKKKGVHAPWRKWHDEFDNWEHMAVKAWENAKTFPSLMSSVLKRLSPEVIVKGKIGWLADFNTFPVFSWDGKFADLVVRHKTSKVYEIRPHEKDEPVHLYSADWSVVCASPVVYVPFGIFDMWTLHLLGLPTLTGISGKAFDASMFDGFRKKIIAVPDFGELDAALKLKSELGWRGSVKNLNYPEDCKDPNDVFVKHGPNLLRDLILH